MAAKALVIKADGSYQAHDGALHGAQKGTRYGVLTALMPRLPPQL